MLSIRLPVASNDFQSLTDSYCRAKYTTWTISMREVDVARNAARRLRALLRTRRGGQPNQMSAQNVNDTDPLPDG